MLFDDLWLTTLRDAMSAVAASEPGVELVMVDSKEDVATQLGQVENFVTQGLDAIVLVAANTDATDPMTQGRRRCRHPAGLRQPQAEQPARGRCLRRFGFN